MNSAPTYVIAAEPSLLAGLRTGTLTESSWHGTLPSHSSPGSGQEELAQACHLNYQLCSNLDQTLPGSFCQERHVGCVMEMAAHNMVDTADLIASQEEIQC